jgi:hypothetical protein
MRNAFCIVTFILRIIGCPTALEPAIVLAPQFAETCSQVSLLFRVFALPKPNSESRRADSNR